jgi:tetratricopeptide (TPR) repeat protein
MAESPPPIRAVLRRNLWQALHSGAYDEAEGILARLKDEDPLSIETRGLELEYLLRRGRLEEAEALAGQLLELHPGSARLHYLAGQLAYRCKDYARAQRHFRESLHLHPHWRTRRLLAKTLTQAGGLDEAEAVLLSLLPQRPECLLDLAWLYERRGDEGRALKTLEDHLERRPQDAFARSQRLRLRARLMEPGELLDEVDTLLELGEEVPAEVLPVWLEALLRTGQGGRAREFLRQRRSALDARAAASMGWACYRLQAYDLAFELFLASFPGNRGGAKFLCAMESAAARSGNVATLIDFYKAHAEHDKKLYGRIKTLQHRSRR